MSRRILLVVPFLFGMAACAEQAAPPSGGDLDVTTRDATTIAGTFVHAGSVIDFSSTSADNSTATLHFDINGANLDITLDLAKGTMIEDGHDSALFDEDIAAITALRDAFVAQYPDAVTGSLAGRVLAGYADRLTEAPSGATFVRREIVAQAPRQKLAAHADADGCGGDGVTCLWGEDGWDYAVYDAGDNGYCYWQWAQYGNSAPQCQGRCGAGCAWYDHDYTWDCFDHDKCIDTFGGSTSTGNYNCTDEFWDASDDWVATVGSWC